MNWKAGSALLKVICVIISYMLSYYCFSKTDLFNMLGMLLGAGAPVFLAAALLVAVFAFLAVMLKGDPLKIIFAFCAGLCLVAASGFSKIDWIGAAVYYLTRIQVTFRTDAPAAAIAAACAASAACILVAWLLSGWDKEYGVLISKGFEKKEVSSAFAGRTRFLLLVFSAAGLITAVIFLSVGYFGDLFKLLASFITNSPAFLVLAGVLPFLALLYVYIGKSRLI